MAHDLAPALARAGIQGNIFAVNEPEMPRQDRTDFFRECGVDVTLLGRSYARATGAMLRACISDSRRRKVFLALPSLSHPSAVGGTARGFFEMITQFLEAESYPEVVFIAAASGATLAGFLVAENALRAQGLPAIRVIGVQVHQGPIRIWVRSLIRWSERRLGLSAKFAARRIELIDSELHGGFGRYSRALAEICRRVEGHHGFRIDPFFGGKTWSVMETFLAEGGPRGPVVYWHCGYTPEWESLGASSRQADVSHRTLPFRL